MKSMTNDSRDGSAMMMNLELNHERDWHTYLQIHVDELQRRMAALPTEQNIAEWTRVAFLGAMNDSHHALSDVLRCIIEINASDDVPSTLTLGVDSALYQCIDSHLYIDQVATQLLPLADVTMPNSWAEL
jgi:hypothetical protein